MTKTEHYQLNQWDAADQVKRTDFNEDNAKIDAALAGKADNSAFAQLQAANALKADSSSVSRTPHLFLCATIINLPPCFW